MIAELSALSAALCWAIGGLIAVSVVRRIGAVNYNHLRMLMVGGVLCILAWPLGGWETLDQTMLLPLLLSGLIGIFIGDTALFSSMQRLGPRRTGVIFAANAPFTAIMGSLLYQEQLSSQQLLGGTLIIAGVVVTIWLNRPRVDTHAMEQTQGSLSAGILFGLLSALGQAAGAIIAKPVMEAGADPVAASAVRMGAAAAALSLMFLVRGQPLLPPLLRRWDVLWPTLLSGMIGMGLGMSLLLFALAQGKTGIVATLSSTAPVLILPLLWLGTRQRPAAAAWWGGVITVLGTGALLLY